MATILVVDDVSANREVLVTILGSRGHTLRQADDGLNGLAAVRAEKPDLVITDLLMPVMGGHEFVTRLRQDPKTRAIPVVLYTAHYAKREAMALSSTVAGVLTKPVVIADVVRVVDLALAGGVAVTEADRDTALRVDQDQLRLLGSREGTTLDALEKANARLRAVINVGLELASERDPDKLLQGVCAAARDLFGATYVTLGIVDLEERTLARFASCGDGAADFLSVGAPVAAFFDTVMARRRAWRGENLAGSAEALALPPGHLAVKSFLAAPVASPDHVYGWFCLVGNEGRTFTDEDEDLLTALSGQVGRVYEAGHFHRLAQARATALEAEVAERVKAEVSLRRERDRSQRFLDTAAVILLALDLDGRITLVNPYACSVLGWTSQELQGRLWVEACLPERDRAAGRERQARLIAGDLRVHDAVVITRSGEERIIEWRDTLLRDDGGDVVGSFSSGIDVTDQARVVEALRVTEERMRIALDESGAGIWDVSATGDIQWTDNLETQYGVPHGTFAGTFDAFVERIHPDDRVATVAAFAAAMQTGGDFTVNNRSQWPDGTVRWLTSSGRFHFDQAGGPVRGIGISMDVTERHLLEAQYQHAQKMEAIGRLAGGVAHDFNNLLTVILGYCQILLEGIDPRDRDDVVEIQRAGVSAAALTRQLLTFSRKEIVTPGPLNVSEAVQEMRGMLSRLIREDVEIVLKLQPDVHAIMADRAQLEQILINLAVNARDAMPDGGTLTIATANVELGEDYARQHIATAAGSYVALTLSDTGTGITPAARTRLFEPFFTTKPAGQGSGLGLATVHGIVTRGGGSITVDSVPGVGSVFTVYFPRTEAAPMIAHAPPRSGARTGGETLLVVEDAAGLRELTRKLLESRGYTVLVAANADEATTEFRRHPEIAVILTDVVMPGRSGPQLVQALMELRPELRVIYMSGYTEHSIVHQGVLDPGIAFLHKPFTPDELGGKVRDVLDAMAKPGASIA
ncbi:MAG TPA: response regulator [Gemmatimonadaceae bacterium]|nr:response regulator [Gemmatimonadaceae bacterium]